MSKQDKKELRQQIACEWLEQNYLNYGSLRHDVVGDRLQIRIPNLESLEDASLRAPQKSVDFSGTPLQDAPSELQFRGKDIWRNLTDKDINTMVCQCVTDSSVNISVTEMWTALKSDLVPAVHPLREWLNGLRPWSSSEPDWIDMVAQKVVVKGDGQLAIGNRQEYWRKCFKKWFVAMVASWMKDEVVNHTVLVLVGRQGIYKTTWLDRLMPPELRAYSSKLPLSGQISKDDRLRLCENGLLNIDELDAICGREMNIVKSLLTSTDVNERAAYGRLKERRVRLASFCASTNNREFLTDITGNRRWLPFEVESIQNPFDDIILYEHLYAQAKAYVECGYFAYWFDMDEIEVLEQHNEKFRALENEEELLNVYFAVPAADSMNSKFLTTAEISEKLISAGNIKRPMPLSRLGMILGQHGFIASRQGTPARRGWIVYERDSEEINAERKLLSRAPIASTDSIF
jgi:hypothetical protein